MNEEQKRPDKETIIRAYTVSKEAIDLSTAFDSDDTSSHYARMLEVVVSAWETQQKDAADARRRYAKWTLWLFASETAFACLALAALGFGRWRLSPWEADAFFVGVFAQVAVMAATITKYLFPSGGADTLRLMEAVLSKAAQEGTRASSSGGTP